MRIKIQIEFYVFGKIRKQLKMSNHEVSAVATKRRENQAGLYTEANRESLPAKSTS